MTFLRQCFVVWRRQMRMSLRSPIWVVVGMLQPVLYLVLFAPLLGPIATGIGYDNAYVFFVPGLLVQLGTFGALFAGFALIGEKREGVLESERVTPANRTALLVGRLGRDITQLFAQVMILVLLGWAMGLRAPVTGVATGVVLTLLIGTACAAGSNALAMGTSREDLLAPVINTVMMPVLLLSGILLPMSIGSAWLQTASDLMPIRYVVDAVRGSFSGDVSASTLAAGTGWAAGLCVLALWWGTAAFRREQA
ncbi:ABC transporter permease [Nocardioides plantarum]|uniref:Transport permease protein n=1 Tax=Nocardioides plantarum TaxID=29299 RepID=A0ABV5K6Z0_9ACTN|nr:ABC transporter permease [Nocardioides plantarum]